MSNETVEQTSTYTDNWRKAYPTTRLVARSLRVLEGCAGRVCWESVRGECAGRVCWKSKIIRTVSASLTCGGRPPLKAVD